MHWRRVICILALGAVICLFGAPRAQAVEISVEFWEEIIIIQGSIVIHYINCGAYAEAAAWDPVGLMLAWQGPVYGCPASASAAAISPTGMWMGAAAAFADKDFQGNVTLSSAVLTAGAGPGGAYGLQAAGAVDWHEVIDFVIIIKTLHIYIVITITPDEYPPAYERITVDSPELGMLFDGRAGVNTDYGLEAYGDLNVDDFTETPTGWECEKTVDIWLELPTGLMYEVTDIVHGVAGCCWCLGDMNNVAGQNCDDIVDFTDFTIVANAWGSQQGDPNYSYCVDLDGSGAVDFTDFTLFSSLWLGPCRERDHHLDLYSGGE